MKKECKRDVIMGVMLVFTLIVLAGSVNAAFSYSNYGTNIQTRYTGGELIKGIINISLKSEGASSSFRNNINGSVKLIDFLNANGLSEGEEFTCSIKKCENGYSTGDTLSALEINEDSEEYVGLKVEGNQIEAIDLKLTIDTNSPQSCQQSFILDFLANNTYKIQNTKYVDIMCGNKLTGCFSENSDDFEIAEIQNGISYCEKIELPIAPAFKIGGKIMNSSRLGTLKMNLYDSNWETLGECDLPRHTTHSQDLKCIVEYPNMERNDFYVCINVNNANTNYTIRTEQDGKICGYGDIEAQDSDTDFELFAEALKFDSAGITLNESTFDKATGESLTGVINDYITDKYNDNCTSANGGCVIPMKITSSSDQTLTFSSVQFKYQKGTVVTYERDIRHLDSIVSKISSSYVLLDISKAMFALPLKTTQKTLQFYIGDKQVLAKALDINVTKGFSFDIGPKFAYLGIDTPFFISTNISVQSTKWTFGDGATGESQNKNINHKYTQSGQYNLSVEVTRSDGVKSAGIFSILVGEPKSTAELLVKKYDSRLGNISLKLNTFDGWVKTEIENKINISFIRSELTYVRSRINSSDTNYTELLERLINLNVPSDIGIGASGALPLEIGYENMDVQYAESLYLNDSISDAQREKVKQEIINWNYDHFESIVDFKEYNILLDNSDGNSYSYYKITMTSKNNSQGSNLIIPYTLSEIKFKEQYNQKEISTETISGTAVPLSGTKTIEFLLLEKVGVQELSAYIAPDISEFVSRGDVPPLDPENPNKKLGKWLYIILIVAFLVVYIIMQEWYKKRYESHLFPNKDDLFNIINFIYNSRVGLLNDEQIKSKLFEMKWGHEQLTYAFRKIDGKRTGMWEIPLFKWVENRKVKKEIQKRQQQNQQREQNQMDARFFNRPY